MFPTLDIPALLAALTGLPPTVWHEVDQPRSTTDHMHLYYESRYHTNRQTGEKVRSREATISLNPTHITISLDCEPHYEGNPTTDPFLRRFLLSVQAPTPTIANTPRTQA